MKKLLILLAAVLMGASFANAQSNLLNDLKRQATNAVRMEANKAVNNAKRNARNSVRGDHKTPEGTFKINQLLNAKGLTHDFKDGKGPIKDAYGPWFLRLDVPGFWDIGIHGTPFPESIGTRATEGCVRLRNEDILDLKSRVKVGTVVIILPDPV